MTARSWTSATTASSGGEAETIETRLEESWSEGLALAGAVTAGVKALAGPDRQLAASDLEVAVLERSAARRAFRRLDQSELADLLPSSDSDAAPAGADD